MKFLSLMKEWLHYFTALFHHTGEVPSPPAAGEAPVTLHPLPPATTPVVVPVTITPVPVPPVVPPSVKPVDQGPNPLDPHLDNADVTKFGTPDSLGYCTIPEIEELRKEIEDTDPAYHLPHWYLVPAMLHIIPDAKDRIAAEWACSQVAMFNWAERGGAGPLYPGFVVDVSVRPGMESVADTIPLKWDTKKGEWRDSARSKDSTVWGDYTIVGSATALKMITGADIAVAVRKAWKEDKRIRSLITGK